MQNNNTPDALAHRRFLKLLDDLAGQNISQNDLALRTGVPPQYVSDVKTGRRTLSELFARRIEEQFGVHSAWLRGTSTVAQGPNLARSSPLRLPVFPHPILGEPRLHKTWGGNEMEVCAAAVAGVLSAELPYILRFGARDQKGKLGTGDLVLVSQAVSPKAVIHVLKVGRKLFLARRSMPKDWQPLDPRNKLVIEPTIVGHCVGILWGDLNR